MINTSLKVELQSSDVRHLAQARYLQFRRFPPRKSGNETASYILRQNFILTVKIAVAVGLIDASPGHCVGPGGAEADVEEVGAHTLTPLKGLALIIPRARGSLQHKKWTKFV